MICPCCGSQVASGVHPALERLATAADPPGQLGRRIIEDLIASFGEWVPISRLVDAAYFDRPDGGPLLAEDTVRSTIQQQKPRLESLGLRIVGRKLCGYRIVWLPGHPATSAIQPRQAA